MLALISRMRGLEERARAASALAKDRFHKRGQLLPRERVALVLDPGTPFIELSTLAGYMFDVPDADKSVPGGGVVAGIGFVSGVRCMVSANDSGIDAGALQPYGLDKTLAGAGNGAGEQAALRAAGRERRRQSAALPRRGFCPRRQHFSQSGAAVGGRPAGGHRHPRLVDRGRRLPNRIVGLHRDGARPHTGVSGRAAAVEGGDGRDRHRGRTRRRRDAHQHFRPRRLSRRGRPRRAAHRARHHGQPRMGPA